MASIKKTDQPTESKKVFHIEVPREDIDKKVEEIYQELRKESALPGFRRGKAPMELIKARFQKAVGEQSADEAINASLEELMKDQELRVIGTPKIENVVKPTDGDQPITFQLEVEYIPEYELDYEGLQIEDVKYEVTETEVGEALDSLRERLSYFEPVEDRPAEKGDHVMVEAETTVDGEVYAPATKSDFFFELGEGKMLPGVEETLIGAEANQEFEIDSKFPEDVEDDAVKGKPCHIKMKVHSIRKKVTPEPDDAFAKDYGFEDLEKLKQSIRTSLAAEASSKEHEQRIQKVISALLDKNPVVVPPSLISARYEYLKTMQASQLAQMGTDEEEIKNLQEKYEKSNQETAERQSRLTVVLSDIADKEEIKLSDEEFDDNLERTAQSRGYSPEAFATYVFKNRMDGYYKSLYMEDKVLNFLLKDKTEILPPTEGEAESPQTEETAQEESSTESENA